MRDRTYNRLAALLVAAAGALPLALVGCSTERVVSVTTLREPAPAPNSPIAVVRLVEWAWNQRDTTAIRDAFTGDFQFVFAALDTFGNVYRSTPWTYADELIMSKRVFVGGSAYVPPATRCDVTFGPDLVVTDDPRPGKGAGWHKLVTTIVDLWVRTELREYRIAGHARFYVTRGDSAIPPPGDTGRYPMDSTRWLIERWEDDTLPEALNAVTAAATAGPLPAETEDMQSYTWGALKAIYRKDSPVGPAP